MENQSLFQQILFSKISGIDLMPKSFFYSVKTIFKNNKTKKRFKGPASPTGQPAHSLQTLAPIPSPQPLHARITGGCLPRPAPSRHGRAARRTPLDPPVASLPAAAAAQRPAASRRTPLTSALHAAPEHAMAAVATRPSRAVRGRALLPRSPPPAPFPAELRQLALPFPVCGPPPPLCSVTAAREQSAATPEPRPRRLSAVLARLGDGEPPARPAASSPGTPSSWSPLCSREHHRPPFVPSWCVVTVV